MHFSRSGLLLCARYAFAPNSLHYCGPEKQTDLLGYLENNYSDQGLAEIINHFETLYPYLKLIAGENRISDPFDLRVVEAYWLGNNLFKKIRQQPFADHLADDIKLKQKLPRGKFYPLLDQIIGGLPNHTFHVLNIYLRTGHLPVKHTLETMDNCRISWGKIISMMSNQSNLLAPHSFSEGGSNQKSYTIETSSLEYAGDTLKLGPPQPQKVTGLFVTPKVGDWVSVHWGQICDVLTPRQVLALTRYTKSAIQHVNMLTR